MRVLHDLDLTDRESVGREASLSALLSDGPAVLRTIDPISTFTTGAGVLSPAFPRPARVSDPVSKAWSCATGGA